MAAPPGPAATVVAPAALLVVISGVTATDAELSSMRPLAGPAGHCRRDLRPAFSSGRESFESSIEVLKELQSLYKLDQLKFTPCLILI